MANLKGIQDVGKCETIGSMPPLVTDKQYFRNKLGPNTSNPRIVHLVRAAQGFWQAASPDPQHALRKRFSTDFIGKIYIDHHIT